MGTTEVTGEGGVLEALAESHVAQTRLDFLETQPPLAEATSLTHIARAAFEQGVRKLGAAAAVLTVLDDTRTHLKLVAATGYSPAYLRAWHEFPLELATPISDAVRERRTVVVGSLGEIHARYPHLRLPDERPHALIAFPVEAYADVVGGVGLRFDVVTIHELAARDLEIATELGSAAAGRLVEAHLVERLRATVEQLQTALDSRVVLEQAKASSSGAPRCRPRRGLRGAAEPRPEPQHAPARHRPTARRRGQCHAAAL